MNLTIPKIETAHDTIKQENVACPKYRHEDDKSHAYEPHDRLKVKKGVKTKNTGGKPHKCDQCDRCFARLGTLKLHKLTHMERIKFKCPLCKRSYFSSTNLKYTFSSIQPFNPRKKMEYFLVKGANVNLKQLQCLFLFNTLKENMKVCDMIVISVIIGKT